MNRFFFLNCRNKLLAPNETKNIHCTNLIVYSVDGKDAALLYIQVLYADEHTE
jgi:hypothetical protein